MIRVFKYHLRITDEQDVLIERFSRVLSVGVQNEGLYVWALVDDKYEKAPTHFYIVGTGNKAGHLTESRPHMAKRFIGTVQMPPFVWHVFVEQPE